jgi:hypothetical protein
MPESPAAAQPFNVPDAHRAIFAELAKLVANTRVACRFGVVELEFARERQRLIIR